MQACSRLPSFCAGDVYEHASLYSLRTGDEATMERCFTQVKAFYADTRYLGGGRGIRRIHGQVGN